MNAVENFIHKFERAGLGKAPFHCTGMSENVYVACQGAPHQPGGSCDYCGNGIMYEFHIQSADGKKFKVGCDCVLSLNSEKNKACTLSPLERQVKALKSAHEKKLRDARKAKKFAAVKAELDAVYPQVKPAIALLPHPNEYFAGQGKTLLDYVDYFRRGSLSNLERALAACRKHTASPA